MDHNHKLDAPDNEELKNIEQVADRSELSALYRTSSNNLGGELVSADEREQRRQKKMDTMSFGIRKKFFSLGILIPLPIIFAGLVIATVFSFITEETVSYWVIPMIVIFFIWVISSYSAIKRVFATFYEHGVQAAPFILILLLLLAASMPFSNAATLQFHENDLLLSTMVISGISWVLSIILCAILLVIWTTPKLKGIVKLLIIAGVTTTAVGAAIYYVLS